MVATLVATFGGELLEFDSDEYELFVNGNPVEGGHVIKAGDRIQCKGPPGDVTFMMRDDSGYLHPIRFK